MTEEKKTIDLVIDRERWIRGYSTMPLLLRKDDGKMCCLGFLAKACGADDLQIQGITSPQHTKFIEWPTEILIDGSNSLLTQFLMAINDDVSLLENDRESKIVDLMTKIGVTVTFV